MSATKEGARVLSVWLEDQVREEENLTALPGVVDSPVAFAVYDPETDGVYTVTVLPAKVAADTGAP